MMKILLIIYVEKIIGAELADNFSGVWNRKGFGIFINRANGKKYIGLEYRKFIIIISHEVIGYYSRNLINSNPDYRVEPYQK